MSERKTKYESYLSEMQANHETQISLTDPDSRLMKANGKLDVCDNVQTAVDSKHKLIVAYSVGNNASDKNQMSPMVEKTVEMLGTNSFKVVVDSGYESASDIANTIEQGITPHVAGSDIEICLPVIKEEEQKEILSHTHRKTVYAKERNIAIFPMGKILYPGYHKKQRGTAIFYNGKACSQCSHKCTKGRSRKFDIVIKNKDFTKEYDDSDLWLKQVRITADKELVRRRKNIVEHPYGTIKRAMDAGYVLTKGKLKVSGEFALTFLAYNMKRVINIVGVTCLLQALRA